MTREEKSLAIKELTAQLSNKAGEENHIIYLADLTALNATETTELRRACFKADIKLEVVKNTFLEKAMKASGLNFGELPSVLKGNTSVMYAEVGNAPAKLIKAFRKKTDKIRLKGAYINGAIFVGDEQLETLVSLKSREELIGDIIGLLQAPAQRLAGVLKAIAEKEQ